MALVVGVAALGVSSLRWHVVPQVARDFLLVLSFNRVGDALRDLLDPRAARGDSLMVWRWPSRAATGSCYRRFDVFLGRSVHRLIPCA